MMQRSNQFLAIFGFVLMCIHSGALGEPSHKTTAGDRMPSFALDTGSGERIDQSFRDGHALVLIYVIAEQRGSERAIADASRVIQSLHEELGTDEIKLLFVSDNSAQSGYFDEFWKTKEIHGRLGFDVGRKLYAELGLIAFPSTFVIGIDGRVLHTLSTYSPNFSHVLDGYARHAMGNIDDDGLAEYLEARSLPTSSRARSASHHRSVARMMKEKGLLEAAEGELLKALEYDGSSMDARLDLADLYVSLDRLDEANGLIEQTLADDSENRHAMLLEGIILFRQSDFEKAQRVLIQALELNPDPSRVHYYLGRVYETTGNSERALYHYRQALGRLLDEPTD